MDGQCSPWTRKDRGERIVVVANAVVERRSRPRSKGGAFVFLVFMLHMHMQNEAVRLWDLAKGAREAPFSMLRVLFACWDAGTPSGNGLLAEGILLVARG